MKSKIAISIVLFLIVFVNTIGCSRQNESTESFIQDQEKEKTVLIDRFEETIYYQVGLEEFQCSYFVTPYYDEETEVLTVFVKDDNDQPMLVSVSSGGEVISEIPLSTQVDGEVVSGVIDNNSFCWCEKNIFSGEIYLKNYFMEEEELISGCVSDYFHKTEASKTYIAKCNNTYLWSSGIDFGIFDGSMNLVYSNTPADTIIQVGFLYDECPSYVTQHETEQIVWRVDLKNHKEEIYERIPMFSYQIFYAGESDYYFYSRDGIHRMLDHGDAMLMSRQNSGFTDEQMILCIVNQSCFITCDIYTENASYVLWKRAEDIEYNSKSELNVVFTGFHSRSIDRAIADYNRFHPDVMVMINDLSAGEMTIYSSKTDDFIFQLANNLAKADVIVTTQNNSLVDVVLEKHLYQDLTPFIVSDETINEENIFSPVLSTFQTRDGKIWGLPPSFSIETITGLRNVLETHIEGDNWTLDDFLAFASSLPEEIAIGKNLTQMSADSVLGRGGFNRWIDYEKGKCLFTDESFGRYLDFVNSLPKGYEEMRYRYPFIDELFQIGMDSISDTWKKGKVVLDFDTFNGAFDIILQEIKFGTWGTDNLVRVGYPIMPGESEGNVSLSSSDVCIITKSCQDVEMAWNLIRTFFEVEPLIETERIDGSHFPSLKSEFEKTREAFAKYYISYSLSADGIPSTAIFERGKESAEDAARRVDGMLIDVTYDYTDRIYAMLEESNTIPITDYTPSDVHAIIKEEISAFNGGGQNKESCIKNIQSRISIWLAEHQ